MVPIAQLSGPNGWGWALGKTGVRFRLRAIGPLRDNEQSEGCERWEAIMRTQLLCLLGFAWRHKKPHETGCGFYDRKARARTLGWALLPAAVGLVSSGQPSFSLPFMTVDVSGTLISDNNIIGLNQLDL